MSAQAAFLVAVDFAATRRAIRGGLTRSIVTALACAASLIDVSRAVAQDAVALSGGGSRGIAHAGALAGIRQRGYDPDLIVGTSMGSVIGALYAAGLPTDSIIGFARKEDWAALFTPLPLLLGVAREPRQPVIDMRLGGGDARTATGLISDTRINRRLVRALFDAGARAGGNFDKLPRRYRAVATDMVSGKAVVLDSGDFAIAARASMAVPGVFAPVTVRGRVLADGGVASYLPVGIARAAGARRVIAVDVLRPSSDLGPTDPITLAFRAVRLTLRNTLTANDSPTFLIVPDISQRFSAAYFPRRPDHLIAAGLSAARSSLPQATSATPARRAAQPPPTRFSELVIESSDTVLAPLVRSAFGDVPLDRYDPRAIQRAVDRLYATGLFSGVWPRVEGAGTAVLIARADAAAPTRIAGAPGYDNDRGGRIWLAVRNRPEAGPFEIAAFGSYGTLHAVASAEARGAINFAPSLAWTLGGGYRESEIRIFDGDDIDGERDVSRAGGWLGLQWRSIVRERDAAITFLGEHVHDDDGEDGASVGAALRFDEIVTPARVVGVPVLLQAEARFGEVGYQSAQFAGSIDGGVANLLVAAAARIGIASDDAPPDVFFALGDDHWVPGLRWGQERGRALIAAGFDIAYPIVASGYLRLRARAGFAGDSFDDANTAQNWVAGAGLAGVWHVVVGTVELGAAVTDRGDWRLELNLGPVF